MSKANQENVKLNTTERSIDQAIERIYRTYGTNLSAFFADVQKRLERDQPPANGEKREPAKQAKR